jgi:transposase
MKKRNVKTSELCIGIDLGDRESYVCALDRGTGEIVEEYRVRTTREALLKRFGGLKRARVAIEVGSHSPWISRLLEEQGHEVIVANSYKLRLIYENDSKSDRVDAQYLARLAATGMDELLHPIRHRGEKAQAGRALVLARDRAVSARTMLINTSRGLVKSLGGRLPSCHAEGFHKRVRDELPPALAQALEPLLDVLEVLTQKIRVLDKRIELMGSEQYPETARLRQIKGVGPILALNYALTLDDPSRFEKSRVVGAFVGLRPKRRSSSKSDPELRISKAGDSLLRRHLVLSAQYILGPFGEDSDLRRWGLALAARGRKNAKKRAVVAVARKLAVLLHSLWTSGEDYEPLRNANRTASRAAKANEAAARATA